MNMMEIIEALLLKNRTIVSSDFEQCLTLLAEELPLVIHRYPSGSEYGTWVIPPQWDVKDAFLSDGEKVIASIEDHPLFLAPYSHSFTGWLSRDELLTHVRTSEDRPDDFVYEYRLASDYRRRLNEWIITLPHNLTQGLDQPCYFVDIQVETRPGHMLVGESTLKGRHDYTFAFLTHLCHPGQANDGLAGVAVAVEVMRRLRLEIPEPNYSYQLLVMPETIGSSVYLATNEERIDSYLGAIFIEMPGIRSPLSLKGTRRGNSYLDRVIRHVTKERGIEFTECAFREQWGNDELVFDSPGVGIPGASIQRFPYHWYHTSGDNLGETDESRLDEVVREIPQSYLQALFEVIGNEGTIVVPTFTTSFGRYGTPFVLEDSPSEMGVFSEHVRKSPGAFRTLHPIQSLTALGDQAQALAENHPSWNVGYDTIWDRMLQRDGKVLTIGISLRRSLSFVHHMEFLACVPYLYHKVLGGEVYAGGVRIPRDFQLAARYLQYEIAYDLTRLESDLSAAGVINQAPLGGNAVWTVPMKAAFEVGMRGLRQDPYYFLQKSPSFVDGEMPCDGTTIERERVAPKYFLV